VLTVEPQLIEAFVKPGKTRLEFRPVLDFNPRSQVATEAAYCAGDQDPARFWAMHNLLFEQQAELWAASDAAPVVKRFAGELGLRQADFTACLDSGKFKVQVVAHDQARRDAGIRQRPSFRVVGPAQPTGRLAAGSQPFDAFQKLIRDAGGN
jgi:protein-disulfide isomerase